MVWLEFIIILRNFEANTSLCCALCTPDSVVSESPPPPPNVHTLCVPSQLANRPCLRVNPTLLHHQAEPAVSAAPVCQLGCVFPSTVRPLSSQTVTSIQMSPLSTFKVTQCNQKAKMHDLVNKLLLILLRA